MEDASTVALEDFDNSEHSGRWSGGLITISRTLHDISPYGDTIIDFTLLDWPASPNWKFLVQGFNVWGTVNWASGSPILSLRTAGATNISIPLSFSSGSKTMWGLLDAHYNGGVLRGLILDSGDGDILLNFWAGTSGALTGNMSFSIWGVPIPDVEDSTS